MHTQSAITHMSHKIYIIWQACLIGRTPDLHLRGADMQLDFRNKLRIFIWVLWLNTIFLFAFLKLGKIFITDLEVDLGPMGAPTPIWMHLGLPCA